LPNPTRELYEYSPFTQSNTKEIGIVRMKKPNKNANNLTQSPLIFYSSKSFPYYMID
jgi:hypothetical protein